MSRQGCNHVTPNRIDTGSGKVGPPNRGAPCGWVAEVPGGGGMALACGVNRRVKIAVVSR